MSTTQEVVFPFIGNGILNDEPDAWVESSIVNKTSQAVWEPAKVITQAGPLVSLRIPHRGDVVAADLRKHAVCPASPNVVADVTSLHFINEPCILQNLQVRSLSDKPYTFMGNQLIAVNPLQPVADPENALGTSKASRSPHPWAVAEGAYQQMSFYSDSRRKHDEGVIANQSIINSGESGSGKTESSKMVLRHLVEHTKRNNSSNDVDTKLLQSNPITESFGNAATLRNHNSSRFGKFMKLHFTQIPTKRGSPADWSIESGEVNTYLLERSRVTLHNKGERNFHVFYQLVAGAQGTERQSFGLDEPVDGFTILKGQSITGAPSGGVKGNGSSRKDKRNHDVLRKAFLDVGLNEGEVSNIFATVAAILHLGNAEFVNEEQNEGDVAREKPPASQNPTYSGLQWACDLLGVQYKDFFDFLVSREVVVNGEKMVSHRNAKAASYARNAVSKGIYSLLFDWLVSKINHSLGFASKLDSDDSEQPFIGVLDIFGFESFQTNNFEQLLINYTNEALQSVFNYSVFVSETQLYKEEGLVLEQELSPPPNSSQTMQLLNGGGSPNNKSGFTGANMSTLGVLGIIDAESQNVKPNDKNMVAMLHRYYDSNKAFIRPHPKDASDKFIIKHYAGAVVYTGGSFVEKNNDSLPEGVYTLFSKSTRPIIPALFESENAVKKRRSTGFNRVRNKKKVTVVSKFKKQILSLVDELGKTNNSFIRCIKPNAEMERISGKTNWFNRQYVSQQLRCLSIPQTAEVLKSGLPTRMEYRTLVELYQKILPKDAIDMWKAHGKSDRLFIAALFFAFNIPRSDYRLGHTKVFFRAGKLAELDKVLQSADKISSKKGSNKNVGARFKLYYVRARWRSAYVKVMTMEAFIHSGNRAKKRVEAAIKVQSFFRMAARLTKFRLQEAEKRMKRQAKKAKELEEQKKHEDILEKERKVIEKRQKSVVDGLLKVNRKELKEEEERIIEQKPSAVGKESKERKKKNRTKKKDRKPRRKHKPELRKEFSGISDVNTLMNLLEMDTGIVESDSEDETSSVVSKRSEPETMMMFYGVPISAEDQDLITDDNLVRQSLIDAKIAEREEYEAADPKPSFAEREKRLTELEEEYALKAVKYAVAERHVQIISKRKKKKETKKKKHSKKKKSKKKGTKVKSSTKPKSKTSETIAEKLGKPDVTPSETEDAKATKKNISSAFENPTPIHRTSLFNRAKDGIRQTLSFSDEIQPHPVNPENGEDDDPHTKTLPGMMKYAHAHMMQAAKELPFFKRAIVESREVKNMATEHNGKLDSRKQMLKGAGGNSIVRDANVVDQAEAKHPVKSAEASLSMLHDMMKNGKLMPHEYAKLTKDTRKSVRSPMEAMPPKGIHKPKTGKFAAQAIFCSECHKLNNTSYGDHCSSCDALLVRDIPDASDDEESLSSTSSMDSQLLQPGPLVKKKSKLKGSKKPERKAKHDHSEMPSDYDDWFEPVKYNNGEIKMRFDKAKKEIDNENWSEVMNYFLTLAWDPIEADSRKWNTWWVVHDFNGMESLKDETVNGNFGKYISKETKDKLISTFPSQLSPKQKDTLSEEDHSTLMKAWVDVFAAAMQEATGKSGKLSVDRKKILSSVGKMFRRNSTSSRNPLTTPFFEMFFHFKKHCQ